MWIYLETDYSYSDYVGLYQTWQNLRGKYAGFDETGDTDILREQFYLAMRRQSLLGDGRLQKYCSCNYVWLKVDYPKPTSQ
jgi:hypothetical protein